MYLYTIALLGAGIEIIYPVEHKARCYVRARNMMTRCGYNPISVERKSIGVIARARQIEFYE